MSQFLGFIYFVVVLAILFSLGATAGALYTWRTRFQQFGHIPLGWIVAAVLPVFSIWAPSLGIACQLRATWQSGATRLLKLTSLALVGVMAHIFLLPLFLATHVNVWVMQVFAWIALICWLVEPFLGMALMTSTDKEDRALGRQYLKTVGIASAGVVSALLTTALAKVGLITVAVWGVTAMATGYQAMLLRMRFFERVMQLKTQLS